MNTVSKLYSAEIEGISAKCIEVEIDLHVGLHTFTIVGLADKALSEAKERVNSAIKNSGAKPPNRENRKITVNLAPADIKKTGSQYDLAIALGYLIATGQTKKHNLEKCMIVGELALDGAIRPINGAVSIAEMAARNNFEYLFIPEKNAREASVIKNIKVIPIETLKNAIEYLEGKREIDQYVAHEDKTETSTSKQETDLSEIKGQLQAKRALIIAAAGGHNLLMIGPPGVGKSMLAQTMATILPELSYEEAIEVTKIYSATTTRTNEGLIWTRPFRTPHHTASQVAIIGGGSNPKPGEVSLAHRGVLFLDELPEFQKSTLESLRQPLESGAVHVARAKGTIAFPAQFCLVAAANPCPCGYYGDEEKQCRCTPIEVIKYQKKMSGPLLDRIDLQVKVRRVPLQQLTEKNEPGEQPKENEIVKKLIEKTRAIQKERFTENKLTISTNAQMSSKQTQDLSNIDDSAQEFLKTIQSHNLSPRSFYRLIKTARTIADLEESNEVTKKHIAESFNYRIKEL